MTGVDGCRRYTRSNKSRDAIDQADFIGVPDVSVTPGVNIERKDPAGSILQAREEAFIQPTAGTFPLGHTCRYAVPAGKDFKISLDNYFKQGGFTVVTPCRQC